MQELGKPFNKAKNDRYQHVMLGLIAYSEDEGREVRSSALMIAVLRGFREGDARRTRR